MNRHIIDKPLHKVKSYVRGVWACAQMDSLRRHRAAQAMARYNGMSGQDRAYVRDRVDYYNKLEAPFPADQARSTVGDYSRGRSWAYHIDFKPLLACFPRDCRFEYLFGDITTVPGIPTFLKSRPIRRDQGNQHSVLLKLNRIRHYYLVKDVLAHEQKVPRAIWRGTAHRANRRRLIERCYGNPCCDVADISAQSRGRPWHSEYTPVHEQLKYRFVISLEGIDVASNVRWIMASNSLCMMPRPNYETWFMEGRLIPGHHYVELRDDYSDVGEKVAHYTQHPDEAEFIINNANAYVHQFRDREREFMISLLVMDKYFRLSGQPSLRSAR